MKAKENFLKKILSGTLTDKELIKLMHIVRGVDQDDCEYCNNIIPETGYYLNSHNIRRLILADDTDDVVICELKKQKVFFKRLGNLLLDLMWYFKIRSDMDLQKFLEYLSDCEIEVDLIKNNDRKDKAYRKLIRELSAASSAWGSTMEFLKKINPQVKDEFDHIYQVFPVFSSSERYIDDPYRDLLTLMSAVSSFLELMSHSIATCPNFIPIADNRIKETITDYTYTMCLRWDGPRLITTPGSDFSAICSLLHEIMTGQREESFSGAINRYAKALREEDREPLRMSEEIDEEVLRADNFHQSIENVASYNFRDKQYKYIIKNGNLDPRLKSLATDIAEFLTEIAAGEAQRYGPHLVTIQPLQATGDDQKDAPPGRSAIMKMLARSIGRDKRERHPEG